MKEQVNIKCTSQLYWKYKDRCTTWQDLRSEEWEWEMESDKQNKSL